MFPFSDGWANRSRTALSDVIDVWSFNTAHVCDYESDWVCDCRVCRCDAAWGSVSILHQIHLFPLLCWWGFLSIAFSSGCLRCVEVTSHMDGIATVCLLVVFVVVLLFVIRVSIFIRFMCFRFRAGWTLCNLTALGDDFGVWR